jgi:hypothetical protein
MIVNIFFFECGEKDNQRYWIEWIFFVLYLSGSIYVLQSINAGETNRN